MAQKVLVCVPVTTEQARLVANGQVVPGPLQVFTVTPMLLDTFGLQPNEHEEAEYAALLLAGLKVEKANNKLRDEMGAARVAEAS